tara:strand:- start:1246 stop:1695 length:450 start_codon:yes stop_codon:yes gene_type:complete
MDNDLRFRWYVVALDQFAGREGHCRVPALHVEVLEGMEVKLGSFVSYLRQRRRKLREDLDLARNRGDEIAIRKLESNLVKFRDREQALESIPGWEWGPLRPGPASKAARNKEIQRLYTNGTRVKALADRYELSRQRIHQIVGPEALTSA